MNRILIAVFFLTSPWVSVHASGGDDGDSTSTSTSTSTSGAAADSISGAAASVITGGNSFTGGDLTGGDLSIGGNRSYVIAPPGLGDVAIARCLGSEAWTLLIGGKQKLVLNQVCMAEFYLKVGRYDLAAQSLCNQPEILEEYKTEAACEIAHDFEPPEGEGEDQYDHDVHDRSDEFIVAYALQEEETARENDDINARLDAMDAARAANVRRYRREQAAQKQADEDFYTGYIEKFEQMQQQEGFEDNE